jgi:hypothetical protein
MVLEMGAPGEIALSRLALALVDVIDKVPGNSRRNKRLFNVGKFRTIHAPSQSRRCVDVNPMRAGGTR